MSKVMRAIAKRALLLTALSAVTVPGWGQSKRTNNSINLQEYTARALRSKFPNVPLITQDNQTVRFYDDLIKGKVVLIQFMFTKCEQLCPMTTPNLVKVQKELRKRGAAEKVEMISITVDPVHDRPSVLKEYAQRFHVQPGWRFLTGRKADVDLIRRKLGVWDPDDKKSEHMNVLTIGREPSGQWIAVEALAKPDDLAYTVLRLVVPSK